MPFNSAPWRRRLFDLPDRLVWAVIFRDFQRHPEVLDWFTNPDVGHGYGLARWTRPLSLLTVALLYGTSRKTAAAIDLGSGDGATLRCLRLAGFTDYWGIEFDAGLAELSRINEPTATVLTTTFCSPGLADLLPRKIGVVVAFNPAPAEEVHSALRSLATRSGSFRFLYCNPVGLEDLVGMSGLMFRNKGRFRNIAILDVDLDGQSR